MSQETILTIEGNATADAELRFTPSGAAVANFTIASTPRKFNKQTNEWEDAGTLFMRCSVWRDLAENVAETVTRGMALIATGRLTQREFEKDGQKRTVVELDVTNVGPSLQRASAKVTKSQRGGQQGQVQGQWSGQGQPASDPWAQQQAQGRTQPAPAQSGWGHSDDSPPF